VGAARRTTAILRGVAVAGVNARERDALIRVGLMAVRDPTDRGYQGVGVVRRMAVALMEAPFPGEERERCPMDGMPILQPRVGRRRRWCSPRCRSAAYNEKRRNSDENGELIYD
jgi:hypothetical protein